MAKKKTTKKKTTKKKSTKKKNVSVKKKETKKKTTNKRQEFYERSLEYHSRSLKNSKDKEAKDYHRKKIRQLKYRINKLTQKDKWKIQAKKKKQMAKNKMKKAEELEKENKQTLKGIEPGQPVHNQTDRNKRDRAINKSFKILYLQNDAQTLIEEARNLEIMSKANKGDAEKRRQSKYEYLKDKWKVGDKVYLIIGNKKATILKLNKKSIRVRDIDGDEYSVEPYQLMKK